MEVLILVLAACEESQAVCIAFRNLGVEAYSCDIQPCSGGHPEWHIQCDVLDILNEKWDMIIAFPPCTYLSNAGARHLYKGGVLNKERYAKGLKAKEFFMRFYNADCKHICVENPISSKIYDMPPYSQQIQPYYFGHPVKKTTRLWLKGLPLLLPTNIVEPTTSCADPTGWYMRYRPDRQKIRSKTFPGIAQAMAEQWSILL